MLNSPNSVLSKQFGTTQSTRTTRFDPACNTPGVASYGKGTSSNSTASSTSTGYAKSSGITVDEDSFHCELCDVVFGKIADYNMHCRGVMHVAKQMGGSGAAVEVKPSSKPDDFAKWKWCQFCKSSFTSEQKYVEHCASTEHKRKESSKKQSAQLASDLTANKDWKWCDLCANTFGTQQDYVKHCESVMHQNRVRLAEQRNAETSAPKVPSARSASSGYAFDPDDIKKLNNEQKYKVFPLPDRTPDDVGKSTFAPEFFCQLCMADCTSEDSYQKHISGKKHEKNLAKRVSMQKSGMAEAIANNSLDAYAASRAGSGIPGGRSMSQLTRWGSSATPGSSGSKPVNIPIKRKDITPEDHQANIANLSANVAFIQKEIDEYKLGFIIGASSVVEYHTEIAPEPVYVCELCNVACDPRTILVHMIGHRHRHKYLKRLPNHVYHKKISNITKRSEQSKHSAYYAEQIFNQEGPGTAVIKFGTPVLRDISDDEDDPPKKPTWGKNDYKTGPSNATGGRGSMWGHGNAMERGGGFARGSRGGRGAVRGAVRGRGTRGAARGRGSRGAGAARGARGAARARGRGRGAISSNRYAPGTGSNLEPMTPRNFNYAAGGGESDYYEEEDYSYYDESEAYGAESYYDSSNQISTHNSAVFSGSFGNQFSGNNNLPSWSGNHNIGQMSSGFFSNQSGMGSDFNTDPMQGPSFGGPNGSGFASGPQCSTTLPNNFGLPPMQGGPSGITGPANAFPQMGQTGFIGGLQPFVNSTMPFGAIPGRVDGFQSFPVSNSVFGVPSSCDSTGPSWASTAPPHFTTPPFPPPVGMPSAFPQSNQIGFNNNMFGGQLLDSSSIGPPPAVSQQSYSVQFRKRTIKDGPNADQQIMLDGPSGTESNNSRLEQSIMDLTVLVKMAGSSGGDNAIMDLVSGLASTSNASSKLHSDSQPLSIAAPPKKTKLGFGFASRSSESNPLMNRLVSERTGYERAGPTIEEIVDDEPSSSSGFSKDTEASLANVLEKLTKGKVDTEEDAAAAVQLSNSLTQALIKYRLQKALKNT